MTYDEKILILGGNNYLGIYLINAIKNLLPNITILNRCRKPNPTVINVIKADRNNQSEMQYALSNRHFDYIFDFSGYNKKDIINVISYCSFKHYVFISSTAVYKFIPNQKPCENFEYCSIDENSYGFNKRQAEEEIIAWSSSMEYKYYILRPVYIYGLNDPKSRELFLFRQILNGKVTIIGEGNNLIQFIYIVDFIKIILSLVSKNENTIINIASEEIVTVNDYVNICSNIVSTSNFTVDKLNNIHKINHKLHSPFTDTDRVADVSLLLKHYTGFTSLECGLRETYNYFKSNSIFL